MRDPRTWKHWRTPLAAVVVGVVCAILGVALLWHPIAGWAWGSAHRSDLPPVWGVGFLAVPVTLLVIAAAKAWERWTLEVQVRRSRRSRRHD